MSHPSEQELVMFAVGDADGPAELEQHVLECASCSSELEAIRQLLRATEKVEVPVPDARFEERIWLRQREHLKLSGPGRAVEDTTRDTAPTVEIAPLWTARRRRRTPGIQRMIFAGAVAAMLLVAFLVGLYSSPPGTEIVPEGSPEAASAGDASTPSNAQPGRDRVLLIAVGDHLERARMVLVELVNVDAPNGPVDVRPQQVRAEELLANNRLYRQSASLQGQNDVAEVLDEIERVLVEVARSPGEMDSAEVEWLRQRIVSRDLLFKVKVIEGKSRWNNETFLRPMDAL